MRALQKLGRKHYQNILEKMEPNTLNQGGKRTDCVTEVAFRWKKLTLLEDLSCCSNNQDNDELGGANFT